MKILESSKVKVFQKCFENNCLWPVWMIWIMFSFCSTISFWFMTLLESLYPCISPHMEPWWRKSAGVAGVCIVIFNWMQFLSYSIEYNFCIDKPNVMNGYTTSSCQYNLHYPIEPSNVSFNWKHISLQPNFFYCSM